jgi:flavin reductase (DIM6/NTAB) family NADH-FMN oxidoreductase RutF
MTPEREGGVMTTSNEASADAKRLFRDALGMFPTGVAVVTSATPEGPLGATVSSFTSVSLEPPLVLFSMARSAKSFSAWERTGNFAVNILDEEQSSISTKFARSLSDKWTGLDPRISETTGAPLLPDALAWFECRTWARYDGGDHLIMVGEVISFAHRPKHDARPLVFFGSNYARLEAPRTILEQQGSFPSAR